MESTATTNGQIDDQEIRRRPSNAATGGRARGERVSPVLFWDENTKRTNPKHQQGTKRLARLLAFQLEVESVLLCHGDLSSQL
jgi:hypothetical protein